MSGAAFRLHWSALELDLASKATGLRPNHARRLVEWLRELCMSRFAGR